MKQNYFKTVLGCFMFLTVFSLQAQTKSAQKQKTKTNETVQLTEENQRYFEEYGVVRCATEENEQQLKNMFPNRMTTEQFEQWIAPKIAQVKADRVAGRSARVIYNIPVVIHVIHDGDVINTNGTIGNENISDAQAQSQIDVMNEDFRRLAGTPGGANSTGAAVDVEINFCLAQQNETGGFTTGIVRHDITPPNAATQTPAVLDDWETFTDVNVMKANTQWDPTKYMNMWCIKAGGNSLNAAINPGMGGLLGFAQFPNNSGLDGTNSNNGAANTDGVVAGYNYFGTSDDNDGSFAISAPYDKGRTMTHEVGHFFGLIHIWGDSNCGNDYCADTPQSTTSNGGCPTQTTCDGIQDMVQNYMDYTNDTCMDTFTQDQKDRMVTVMLNSPRRMELATSIGCQSSTAETFILSTPTSVLGNCGSDSVGFTLEMTAINGFDENTTFSASGNPAGSTVAFSPETLDDTGSTVLTVNNLASLTDGTYVITVTATSASETKTINVDLVLGTGVCPSSNTVDFLTSITFVEFNAISNTSALNGPDDGTGFTDFTDLSTDVIQGDTHNLTVNVNPDGNYRTQTKVWIDWNQDCVFDTSTEEYDLGNTTTFDGNDITVNSPLSVVVPADAALGETTMRVSTIYSDPVTFNYPLSCGSNTDGEVEDYKVNVLESLSVGENNFNVFALYPNPTNGEINVQLSTDQDVNVTLYDVRGRKVFANSYNNNNATFNKTINLETISSGLYLIQFESGSKKTTKKLLIK